MNKLRIQVWLLLLSAMSVHASPMRNMLEGHSSPYLAMHGKDPVHWQVWSADVFERARRENKPVFVSIGYFSCHWCHVMQRESYRNPGIAAYLNQHYIPVKVDKELQPALDARLIDFVEKTRGYSGWPLNVFITPDGYPLVGVVYLPPKNLKELLVKLHQAWATDRKELEKTAKDAAAAMRTTDVSAGEKLQAGIGKQYRDYMIYQAFSIADEMQGGFGEENKFPMVPQLMALLDAYAEKKEKRLGKFLRLTLDKMASRGLRDHLHGGFFRYVVDPNWDTPHFEKMLYDNALMAELYMKAGDVLQHEAYHAIARETLDFMLREMKTPQGAFIASLSAIDHKGKEGGYYLWSKQDLKRVLNDKERKVMRLYWGMQHAPALDGGYQPVLDADEDEVATKLGLKRQRVHALIASAKAKLLTEQKKRSLPKDTKVLASWNGLALSALSKAAARYKRTSYRRAANNLHEYILTVMWDGRELKRAGNRGLQKDRAMLEDYAYVLRGLLDWDAFRGKPGDKIARTMMEQAWKKFYTREGWKLSEKLLVKLGATEPVIADGPMPSPSAMMIASSLRLIAGKQDDPYRSMVMRALNRGHKSLLENGLWYASQINVMVQLQTAR